MNRVSDITSQLLHTCDNVCDEPLTRITSRAIVAMRVPPTGTSSETHGHIFTTAASAVYMGFESCVPEIIPRK